MGVAHGARLIPVKVLSAGGTGTYAAIAAGIIWAADNGAKVVNLSLGGTASSQTLCDAVTYALDKGVFVDAASGQPRHQRSGLPGRVPRRRRGRCDRSDRRGARLVRHRRAECVRLRAGRLDPLDLSGRPLRARHRNLDLDRAGQRARLAADRPGPEPHSGRGAAHPRDDLRQGRLGDGLRHRPVQHVRGLHLEQRGRLRADRRPPCPLGLSRATLRRRLRLLRPRRRRRAPTMRSPPHRALPRRSRGRTRPTHSRSRARTASTEPSRSRSQASRPAPTAAFAPSSVPASGSSTLTVSTAGETPAGSYTLTVRGTSGALVHTATLDARGHRGRRAAARGAADRLLALGRARRADRQAREIGRDQRQGDESRRGPWPACSCRSQGCRRA